MRCLGFQRQVAKARRRKAESIDSLGRESGMTQLPVRLTFLVAKVAKTLGDCRLNLLAHGLLPNLLARLATGIETAHDTTDGTELAESQGLRTQERNGNFWQVHIGVLYFPWPSALARQPSRTLRNGRICQSMAGFWGGTDFVSEMSSGILRIDSVTLTHRSASYEKRPHA